MVICKKHSLSENWLDQRPALPDIGFYPVIPEQRENILCCNSNLFKDKIQGGKFFLSLLLFPQHPAHLLPFLAFPVL